MALYGHMLNQRVQASHSDGTTDDYGKPVFADQVQVKARVELVNKSSQDAQGDTISIRAKVWIDPKEPYDAGDKVIFRDEAYRVESRNGIPDGMGKIQLVVLECTEWRA